MSESASLPDIDHYEQACDQAIAMCDGNLRSTIKALIMANEYLETELQELQAAVSCGCAPASSELAQASYSDAPDRSSRPGATPWPMSPITSQCHSCRTTPVRRSRARRRKARSSGALRRAEVLSRAEGSIGAVAFSRTGDPMIGELATRNCCENSAACRTI